MKKTLIATKLRHTESFVHEETVTGTRVQRRSEHRSSVSRHDTHVRFESNVSSDPPSSSEIVPFEGQMDTIPRLSGDRTGERDA